MRCVIVGLGNQGKKRLAVAGPDVVATVDPVAAAAQYRDLAEVPLAAFDAALVCTPDEEKPALLRYLLAHGKHVLVEKPLLEPHPGVLEELAALASETGAACYTAYNHRFEPHLMRARELLEQQVIGRVYLAKFFYGNGTAADVRSSPWRDAGWGVLADLGSHLLDLVRFFFGPVPRDFRLWLCERFENRAPDFACLGAAGDPVLQLEMSLVSWKNTFTVDLVGEAGSIHVNGLCKWGPATLTVRRRVLPSGRPAEKIHAVECADPTWEAEYRHFLELCRTGRNTLENDRWVNNVLDKLAAEEIEKKKDEQSRGRKGTENHRSLTVAAR